MGLVNPYWMLLTHKPYASVPAFSKLNPLMPCSFQMWCSLYSTKEVLTDADIHWIWQEINSNLLPESYLIFSNSMLWSTGISRKSTFDRINMLSFGFFCVPSFINIFQQKDRQYPKDIKIKLNLQNRAQVICWISSLSPFLKTIRPKLLFSEQLSPVFQFHLCEAFFTFLPDPL